MEIQRFDSLRLHQLFTRCKKWLSIILLLALLYWVAVALLLPPVVKPILTRSLSEALNRPVSLAGLVINPFLLTARLEDLRVEDYLPNATLITLAELRLDLAARSLLAGGPVIESLLVVAPSLRIVRLGGQGYNIGDLFRERKKPDAPSAIPPFFIGNIVIRDGSLLFFDRPADQVHIVDRVELAVPFLSSLPPDATTYVKPDFSARVNGSPLAVGGRTKPFALTENSLFNFSLSDIDLSRYQPYLPPTLDIDLKGGTAALGFRLDYRLDERSAPQLLLRGDLKVDNLSLTERSGAPLLTVPALKVEVAPSEILSLTLHVAKIEISEPALAICRNENSALNLAGLFARTAAPEAANREGQSNDQDQAPSRATLFVDELKLVNGEVEFTDLSLREDFHTVIKPVHLTVTDFTTRDKGRLLYVANLFSETGEQLKVTGDGRLSPLQVSGNLEVTDIAVPKYLGYFPENLPVTVASARLGLRTDFELAPHLDPPLVQLRDLGIQVRDLRILWKKDGAELGEVSAFDLEGGALDLSARRLAIARIATAGGSVALKRGADGKLDLAALAPPPTEEKPEPAGDRRWSFRLDRLSLAEYRAAIFDEPAGKPVRFNLKDIRLEARNITEAPENAIDFDLALAMDDSGRLASRGTAAISPLTAAIDLDVADLPLPQFNPYWQERLDLDLVDGRLSTRGKLAVSSKPEGDTNISFTKGEAQLADLRVRDPAGRELVQWESLAAKGIDLAGLPLRLAVEEIGLNDFTVALVVTPAGTLNLRDVLAGNQGEKATPAAEEKGGANEKAPAAEQAEVIRIGRVTLQNGAIDFTDNNIEPNFSTRLVNVTGRMSGLSSAPETRADLSLFAKLASGAPLQIRGAVNPLAEELYADLKASFENIDLTPLSPYAGKYVGYTIRKGKLFLDTSYTIEKRKVDAQNVILLDQFTLGREVASEQALSIPIRLAIALLKNRQGEIHLQLPVSGRLDDPEFKPGAIVFRILFNLLAKAVTSPFAFLGAVFGGGEELSHVDFAAGSSELSEEARNRLDTLRQALFERPGLELDIKGMAATEGDRQALVGVRYRNLLKKAKADELTRAGKPVAEPIVIGPDEEEDYLRLAYKTADFPKPKGIGGWEKRLPPEEMKKLLLAHIEITDEDLLQLATERAVTVKDQFTAQEIEPERLFLVEPGIESEEENKLPASRVEFSLK